MLTSIVILLSTAFVIAVVASCVEYSRLESKEEVSEGMLIEKAKAKKRAEQSWGA